MFARQSTEQMKPKRQHVGGKIQTGNNNVSGAARVKFTFSAGGARIKLEMKVG